MRLMADLVPQGHEADDDDFDFDLPPVPGYEQTSQETVDGLTVTKIKAPLHQHGEEYETGVRRNDDGNLETYLRDSEGRDLVLDTGTDEDIDDLNVLSDAYAKAIVDQDELGTLLLDELGKLRPDWLRELFNPGGEW